MREAPRACTAPRRRTLLVAVVCAAVGNAVGAGANGPVTLSMNPEDDFSPTISGTSIAWTGEVSGIRHAFFWDGISPTPFEVTANLYTNLSQQAHYVSVSGNTVVWQHSFGADLLYWDGALLYDGSAKILALTDDTAFSSTYAPAISGDRVVWAQNDGHDTEIMLWDRTGWDGSVPVTPIPITNNNYDDDMPAIDGPYVVWEGRKGGGDWEIFLWDGTFPIAPQQITNDGKDDEQPDVSNGAVVWMHHDGNDYEIYYWDGTFPVVPIPLTADDYDDFLPAISGPHVVWQYWEAGVGWQITRWNTGDPPSARVDVSPDVASLTPDIDGERVVWSMLDEIGGDYDIVTTTIPEPHAALGALLAWIALALLRGAGRPRGRLPAPTPSRTG